MDAKRGFKILEIQETDAVEEIKRAYRDLITIWHPDRYAQQPRLQKKATEKVKEINAAYHYLMSHMSRPKTGAAPKGNAANDAVRPVSVICPGCHTLNRFRADDWVRHRNCIYCNHPLMSQATEFGQNKRGPASARGGRRRTGERRSSGWGWMVAAVVLCGVIWYWHASSVERAGSSRRQGLRGTLPQTSETADLSLDRERTLEIQRFLKQLGYDVGEADGLPGQRTMDAIDRFKADFVISLKDNQGYWLHSALQRHAAIARRHADWPAIQKSGDFSRWIEEQTIASPERCRQVLDSGTVEQVSAMVNGFKFHKTKPDPLPLPPNGVIHRSYTKGLAPLTIETRADGRHYYVKLVREADGSEVFTAVLKSGAQLTEHVPVGRYRLKYAVGKKWYGRTWLFGSETVYHTMDRILDFKLKGSEIMGYRLNLYLKPLVATEARTSYAFDF